MRIFSHLLLAIIFSGFFVACGDDDTPAPPVSTTPCEEDAAATCTIFARSTLDFTDGSGTAHAVDVVSITDRGEGTGSITMHNDTTYVLNGLVFVNPGQTLIIEPGTVIKGEPGTGEEASALIVSRGGMINAQGTSTTPVILTASADPTYSASAGIVTTGGLPSSTAGLWGGLIVLGNASLNSSPGESAIEGINTGEVRGLYGGSDDADNSGTIRYVSVRHGGSDIGGGNEINGVTMGGVGSGTIIEYVEVFGNKDDGFEWFGGTVNTKYLVSGYNQDDAMDYDEGWRGNNQFWLVFQVGSADRGGEHDGGTDPETAPPYATPTIANASYFGLGSAEGKRALTFRDNAGGHYLNSIFKGYGKGVDIEYLGDATVEDSHNRFVAGELTFKSNILNDVGANAWTLADPDSVGISQGDLDAFSIYFGNEGNTSVSDPMFAADGVTPMTGGVATSGVTANPAGSFFTTVNYKGCVDPATGPTWIAGWTRLSQEF
ncbi:MAG: hypothetical protein AB8F78_02525 [Saprospiraceae bacterium]